jgi:hypothetical protein
MWSVSKAFENRVGIFREGQGGKSELVLAGVYGWVTLFKAGDERCGRSTSRLSSDLIFSVPIHLRTDTDGPLAASISRLEVQGFGWCQVHHKDLFSDAILLAEQRNCAPCLSWSGRIESWVPSRRQHPGFHQKIALVALFRSDSTGRTGFPLSVWNRIVKRAASSPLSRIAV